MTDDEEMPPELEASLRAIVDAFEIPAELRTEWRRADFPDAEIDRRRHPQVGCYELAGTWIHGRPHTCPKWTRR